VARRGRRDRLVGTELLDVVEVTGTPTVLAFGSVLRLFLTTRIRHDAASPWEITGGIELEPSFLAPPYSWSRLAGARY
jgi:hypothetical protein